MVVSEEWGCGFSIIYIKIPIVILDVLLSLRKIVERKKVKSSFTTQMSSQQVVKKIKDRLADNLQLRDPTLIHYEAYEQ